MNRQAACVHGRLYSIIETVLCNGEHVLVFRTSLKLYDVRISVIHSHTTYSRS